MSTNNSVFMWSVHLAVALTFAPCSKSDLELQTTPSLQYFIAVTVAAMECNILYSWLIIRTALEIY